MIFGALFTLSVIFMIFGLLSVNLSTSPDGAYVGMTIAVGGFVFTIITTILWWV